MCAGFRANQSNCHQTLQHSVRLALNCCAISASLPQFRVASSACDHQQIKCRSRALRDKRLFRRHMSTNSAFPRRWSLPDRRCMSRHSAEPEARVSLHTQSTVRARYSCLQAHASCELAAAILFLAFIAAAASSQTNLCRDMAKLPSPPFCDAQCGGFH